MYVYKQAYVCMRALVVFKQKKRDKRIEKEKKSRYTVLFYPIRYKPNRAKTNVRMRGQADAPRLIDHFYFILCFNEYGKQKAGCAVCADVIF